MRAGVNACMCVCVVSVCMCAHMLTHCVHGKHAFMYVRALTTLPANKILRLTNVSIITIP